MFDLDDYIAQLASRFKACRKQTVVLDEDWRIGPQRGPWTRATLRLDVEWKTREVLCAGDFWYRERGKVTREFHYHFMRDKSLIFRLSTHGRVINENDACELRTPIGVLRDGDARLRGFRLSSITLIHAWDLIQKHLMEERMPWEV